MKKVFEYNEYSNFCKITDEELLEMSNISSSKTGIDNIILWVGPNPNSHGYRIKVSNVSSKFDGKDCFTITIPDYKVVGNVNKKLITNKVMKNIISFLELNKNIIIKYSDQEITTDKLIDGLVKIKSGL